MPLYEYACRACAADFELRLKYEERLQGQTCPKCGSTRTVLRLSAPSLVSAGGGGSAEPVGHCPSTGQACGCAHRH